MDIERTIVKRVITDFLAAGYALGVYDGEETVLKDSILPARIMGAMFSTDEDWLKVYLINGSPTEPNKVCGWVRFTYGNDADVICDYTTNFEPIMKPVLDWTERAFRRHSYAHFSFR